jgi:dipeptidyl aminopeptidase/acylaminoacyl peptidase
VADSKGIVVAGLGFSGWRFKVIYRPTPEDEWTTALRLRQEDDESESVYITKIDSNAQTGHVISRHGGDRWGLYEYDFKNKTFGTALFTNPQFDLWRFDYDHAGNLLWASYIDDRERVTWMDEADKALHADLSSAVPDKVAMVESSSRAKDVRIVHTSSSTDPGSYYYFTAASGKMIRLAMANEPLGRASLAPTTYTSYPARDGVNIPAYLTLPVGRDPVGLPLVVMPHGGPFVRDTGDFDFLVQYLANRGYAVLQPNFRGSLGYGQKFLELGHGQFGKAMQDDVDDGVKWLAASGKVDLRRVCIVGWSYGGYVAQVAAFRNPEMYQCAASVAGISDLKAMLRYERRFMFGDQYNTWRAQVAGDASTRELQAVSSLSQVGAIRIPLLIAHGTKDGNVPVSQSDKLAVALRAQGKPYEYLRIDGGDHSLSEEGQRTELLRWLDRFLGAHNPTDVLMATKPAPAAVTTPELP